MDVRVSYYGEDEATADCLWDEIIIDNGTVALSDSYVKEMGLPVAQRFPWDQEKGLYLLNGFYSMHCLVRTILLLISSHSSPADHQSDSSKKTIRQVVLEFNRGLP